MENTIILDVIKSESSKLKPLPVNVDSVDVVYERLFRKIFAFVSNIKDFKVLFVLSVERPVFNVVN